jgi:maleate isomerase
LRAELTRAGIETPVFGSFEVPTEATVVRISERSVREAGRSLAAGADIEALFISCTNLRTLGVISPLEDALGIPVLSSNQVLAWHMLHLAGVAPPAAAPGRLFAS